MYLKNGFVSCTMPSLVLSLALMNRLLQPSGRVPPSTANPWFCVVMQQRIVSSQVHGKLCPLLPYLQETGVKFQTCIQEIVLFSKLFQLVLFNEKCSFFTVLHLLQDFCFLFFLLKYPVPFLHLIAIFAQFITSFYLWLRFKFLMLTSIIMYHQIS